MNVTCFTKSTDSEVGSESKITDGLGKTAVMGKWSEMEESRTAEYARFSVILVQK